MTAPGGIPPGGAGRLLQQLMAAQMDGIAARLADDGTAASMDVPAVRPRDRVEWSAVAEALAVRPDGAADATLASAADTTERGALVERVDAAVAARLAAAAERLPAESRVPAAPPALEARMDANAARLGLLALPLPATPAPVHATATDDELRARRAGSAASSGAADGTRSDAPGVVRPRPSRWRIAIIATVLGALVFVLGATLGGGWALMAIGACAAGAVAAVLGIRVRRRRQTSRRVVADTRH